MYNWVQTMTISRLISLILALYLVACGESDTEQATSDQSSDSPGNQTTDSSTLNPVDTNNPIDTNNPVDTNNSIDESEPSLPVQWKISEDGRRIVRGGFYNPPFFDTTVVNTIYIDFPNDNWQSELTRNKDNDSGINIGATLRYRNQVFEDVGMRYRGATSYRSSGEKKSFSVELDWVHEDQNIDDYKEFKLNNAYGDPSGMRQVLYSHLAKKNHPMANSAFVQVIVNGRNFGLYWKVQKNDRRHAREWLLDRDATRWRAEPTVRLPAGGFGGPGDFGSIFGAGFSSLNDFGPNGSGYETYYTIKGEPQVDDPWQDLANAAHALANTSQENLIEEVGQYLDIDGSLWFLAAENLFADEDGYINKGGTDYYLYFDIATGRIMPINYDGNEVFIANLSTSWGPFHKVDNTDYPLLNILLNNPQIRQRYLAHYRTVLNEALEPNYALAKIDEYFQLIEPYIADSTAVQEYSYQQFERSLDQLRSFFNTRRNHVMNNSELNVTGLNISDVIHQAEGISLARPLANQAVDVSAKINGNTGVHAVYLYYGTGLAGQFNKVQMNPDITESTYTGTIPPQSAGEYVRYYIEAISDNFARTASYNPTSAEHDVYFYQVRMTQDISN